MRFKTVGAGKGSAYRPVDKKTWDERWTMIYGTDEEREEIIRKQGELSETKN